jgi:hypothetical protein
MSALDPCVFSYGVGAAKKEIPIASVRRKGFALAETVAGACVSATCYGPKRRSMWSTRNGHKLRTARMPGTRARTHKLVL